LRKNIMHKSRRILIAFILGLALSACSPEPAALSGRPHFYRPWGMEGTGNSWPPDDTLVYACTVDYPDGYDWQTDSLNIKDGCTVRLYRNGREILALESGGASMVSPDPDTHHLLEGEMLCEYSRGGETVLLCNGEVFLRFDGLEKLCGCLRSEGAFYSLWRDRDGEGLTLRKDGNTIMRRESGRPVSRLGNENGIPGFFYVTLVGEENACFLSLGGTELLVRKGRDMRFLDAILLNGDFWVLYSITGGGTYLNDGKNDIDVTYRNMIQWQDAKIITRNGVPAVSGNARLNNIRGSVSLILTLDNKLYSGGTGLCVPCGQESFLCYGEGRRLTLRSGVSDTFIYGGKVVWESGVPVFFTTECCFSTADNRIFIAVSPCAGNGFPYIWAGRRLGEFPVNGYISAIEVCVSPPS